jgi:hypothetical protein
MVTIAVGVLIATVILSAIPMLSFAQEGDREMAMNNSGKEGGGEVADFISILQKM